VFVDAMDVFDVREANGEEEVEEGAGDENENSIKCQ